MDYLTNTEGPVPLVLDLRIVHDRLGSSSDPNLNGHLHYPHDVDKSLNEGTTDKIRKYRVDYHHNPPSSVSCMTPIVITSGRLHSEFIRLLFLQTHRETDRFFVVSGVHLEESTSGLFHFRCAAFSVTLKAKVGSTLTKASALRILLNVDGVLCERSALPILLLKHFALCGTITGSRAQCFTNFAIKAFCTLRNNNWIQYML